MPDAPHPTLDVLRDRDVRFYLSARFSGVMARTGLHAAVVWHVTETMRDPFWLGVLGAVEFLPVIPLALVGGAVADRLERRNVMAASQLFTAATATLLWSGAGEGPESIWLVLGALFAARVAWTFEFPASSAMLPTLVPPALFQNAVVLSATNRNLAFAAGPLAAGFLIHAGGAPAAFAASAALNLVASAVLLGVRPRGGGGSAARASWSSVRQGVDFVRGKPAVLSAMTLDMLAVILADPAVLLAVFSEEILAVGPRGYGVLASAMGFGTFAMAVALLFARPLLRPGRALLLAVVAFGGAAVVFGLSRSFALSILALSVAGMADQVSQVARSTLIQLSTPDAVRGRVNAVNMVFVSASNELGAAVSGFLAAALGTVVAVVAGGAGCLASAGVVAARVPALGRWRVDRDAVDTD